MFPEDPTPPACAALLLLLPLVACAGLDLARRASADRETRAVVAPAAGFAAWLLCVYAIARLSRSFLPGLVGGTAACALLGVPHAWRLLRGQQGGALRGLARAPDLLFAALATLAIYPAVRCYFHDELLAGGHLSIAAQLENGHFPPRFVIFPQFELNYHYGFDVTAAALSAVLRLSPAGGVDAVTVLAWAYTALLGCHLGRRLCGARHGILAGVLVLAAGGIHLACPPPDAPLGHHMIGYCQVDGLFVNPPLGSYFFQHPFAAGIPLFLAALALLADRESGALRGRYALFALLFAALSECQIVLFATGLASFVAAESVANRKLDARRAAGALVAAGAALGVARALGGFFAPAPYRGGGATLLLHPGVTDSLIGTIEWHARSYGLLLPAGLAGLWLLRRERLFLGLVIAGCLLVPNVLRYAHTWDIVKFTTVGCLALAVTSAAAIQRLLADRARRPGPARLAIMALATALFVPLVAWSATFHAAAWLRTPDTSFDRAPAQLGAADLAVLARLRRAVPAGDAVYRSRHTSVTYAQITGLSVAWPDEVGGSGFSPQIVAARRRLLKNLPADADAWDRETVRWLVLDPADGVLREHADRWVAEGRAEIVMEEGDLRVVHLRPKPR
jgi:hypothetical protein